MRVLIAEDEELALERIEAMLLSLDNAIEIVAKIDSKQTLKDILLGDTPLDLLILDIELADGRSIDLFDEINIQVPAVFTTAYDQFALDAFQHLSLGYLLKPVSAQALKGTLDKYHRLMANKINVEEGSSQQNEMGLYKTKLLLKIGTKYIYRDVSDALYFFADDKDIYMVSRQDNRKYPIDTTLEKLEKSLDPAFFFRISRKFIVHIETINELRGLSNIQLEIRSDRPLLHKLLVSRSKVKTFKNWLNR
jgi:DNA-binding LytR/AlgR family response regulator